MDKKFLKRVCSWVLIFYFSLALLLYFIAGDQFRFSSSAFFTIGNRSYDLRNVPYYWLLAGALGFVLVFICVRLLLAAHAGKETWLAHQLFVYRRYQFLMRQLISREFKTKYRRSVLGVLWSFLNPLITMLVQYMIFSHLFRSEIPNFPLYLLSGIVCFNAFNEATSMSLTSIVANAPLLTKVYVPKTIFPVTKVLSATINLCLSLLPLTIVMLLTGTPIRPSFLLLPFPLFCLVMFSMGIGMILAAMMVFFRDTQFLWGVITMLWMYATPIFYPDSIINPSFRILFRCNPLYQIITFLRTILMDGISPTPDAYAVCLLMSLVSLALGIFIFKKNQDKFIYNF